MQALAAGGNYAAALLAYRELRLRLHRELNAEPDPETQALFRHHRDVREIAGETAGVRDELAPVVVAQPEAQAVQREARLQGGQRLGRVGDGQDRLSAPHLVRLALAEEPSPVR